MHPAQTCSARWTKLIVTRGRGDSPIPLALPPQSPRLPRLFSSFHHRRAWNGVVGVWGRGGGGGGEGEDALNTAIIVWHGDTSDAILHKVKPGVRSSGAHLGIFSSSKGLFPTTHTPLLHPVLDLPVPALTHFDEVGHYDSSISPVRTQHSGSSQNRHELTIRPPRLMRSPWAKPNSTHQATMFHAFHMNQTEFNTSGHHVSCVPHDLKRIQHMPITHTWAFVAPNSPSMYASRTGLKWWYFLSASKLIVNT